MSGFLRFLGLFAVLVGFLVLVVLPLVAGPFLAQVLRDQGLRSDSLQVTVAMFDPFLVVGRSRSMHLSASDVDFSPGIGWVAGADAGRRVVLRSKLGHGQRRDQRRGGADERRDASRGHARR